MKKTANEKASAELLERQIAEWEKESARLQDLIAAARAEKAPAPLDCPFCGSKPHRVRALGDRVDTARCSNNECIASFKSVDTAIWNTRAAPASDDVDNPDHVEQIGLWCDTLDNLVHASKLALPAATHKERLVSCIAHMIDEMNAYIRETP